MSKLQYQEFMWAEMSPDLYDGPECDGEKPRWHIHAEGDMDSEFVDVITLDAKTFPAGTKISISQPCCPRCGNIREVCVEVGDCVFDWDKWTAHQYS